MFTLGIDSSTQGVKALVLDSDTQRVVATATVNFGKDLPEFGSPNGFLPNDDVLVRQADPRMWVAGLNLVLERLHRNFDTSQIAAIGGDGQQHGSVYLDAAGGFSRSVAPIWMDSSTSVECGEIAASILDLQQRTGSPAIERFTGPQIRKFFKEDPAAYAATKRIHLVSSFICSLLIGHDAPIDLGDGAGMNLLNLKTRAWDPEIAAATAPDLLAKLPEVRGGMAGTLDPVWTKYGFKAGIPVAVFTGDNPATLVGTGADRPGTAVISLGTSDVFFAAMESFKTDPNGYGHVFGNPSGGFMSLACFKNGSLARERVRKELGVDYAFFDEGAWAEKGKRLGEGEHGEMAYPYFEAEITPLHAATGIEANFDYEHAMPAEKIVAIVRGQIQNMYDRTRWIGSFDTIRVTGGASRSRGIRETIAEIFGAKVEVLDVPDSAAVGSAILAARMRSNCIEHKE